MSEQALANPMMPDGLRAKIQENAVGENMQRLRVQHLSAVQAAEVGGRMRPAVVLNFNPIHLKLEAPLIKVSIPPCGEFAGGLGKQTTVILKEKSFHPSYVVIRGSRRTGQGIDMGDTSVYYKLRNVEPKGDNLRLDFDVKMLFPLAQAFQFWYMYNGNKGGSDIGGVVVFDGDMNEMKNENGLVRVPEATILPDGSIEVFAAEKRMSHLVEAAISKQRTYFENLWQNCQAMYDDETQRGSIDNIHRIWGRYGRDMGWKQQDPPWLYQSSNDNQEQCKGCGGFRRAIAPGVYANLCVCGRPFDPFTAYMEGDIPITSVHLTRCNDEQWGQIRTEEERREELRTGGESKKKKKE